MAKQKKTGQQGTLKKTLSFARKWGVGLALFVIANDEALQNKIIDSAEEIINPTPSLNIEDIGIIFDEEELHRLKNRFKEEPPAEKGEFYNLVNKLDPDRRSLCFLAFDKARNTVTGTCGISMDEDLYAEEKETPTPTTPSMPAG